MNMLLFSLAGQALITTALTGLIWFVQVVHYPLFARVGTDTSTSYAREHISRTTKLVAPLMIAELALAILSVMFADGALLALAVLGLFLVVAIWISTFSAQVPCHDRLTKSFDAAAHRELTQTNWVRTILWTNRSLIVIWMLILDTIA